MRTVLCREFIKIIPHACALLTADGRGEYQLVECNALFESAFGVDRADSAGVIQAIRVSGTPLSRSLLGGIRQMAERGQTEFAEEQSGCNIILNKVILEGSEYLLALIINVTQEMQTAIKNYESFYNSIGDMFVVSNQDGTILFTNDAVTKTLGYTEEELKGMHVLELHPQEARKEAEEIFADMLQHKRETCPLPTAKKNGQCLPTETRIWFGDWNGEERLFAVTRDLSAEQETLQKFTRLFDRNPACMAISSLETGQYSQVNRAFLKTFGFTEDEVIGKTSVELGIVDDIDVYRQTRKELIADGFFSERILRVRKKTGEVMVGLLSGEVIESQREKVIMTIMVDLTEQVETEQKLARKSALQEILIGLSSRYINCSLENLEEEIQASLETVGHFINADRVYIFDYNYQANTTSNTFEWCNAGIEPQIEYLQGLPLESIPDWVESHQKGESIVIPDVSALDGSVSAVKEILEPQGVKSLITIPMMFEGKCLGYVGFDAVKEKHIYTESEIGLLKFYTQILANIHLRQTHEQELREARIKAEKASEAKNYFIAKTSHELRNPLNGAWGFLNLLEELIPEGKPRTYLSNSLQSLSSAIKITSDLLDISRIETSELRLKDGEIDVFSLMNESVIPYKQEVKNRGIQLDIKLDSDIPPNLVGDFSRLKQIIGNLVLNAVTHAQAKEIEIGCALKKQDQDTAKLLFFVKDDGIGMSAETQGQIFNLFYKKDSNSAGSGLGLPICKELVNLMGGEIWVESAEDQGSVFSFLIPFRLQKEQRAARKAGKDKDTQDLRGLRVLLAEDNTINQTLVIEILKPKEISVTAVQNGAEALRALESSCYDLVLMDIQMPVMDGLEAMKRIRASQNPIPIIALTGSVLPKEKEAYIHSGANEVVEKPIFVDLLLEKIRLALAGEAR